VRWSHVWHLGIKEFYSLGRDPVLLVLILYVFTFSIHSQATSIPETLNKAPIAVVDEDRSQLSERILHALYPPYFLPPERIDTATMDARMDRGLDTFALDIPPDFERDVMAGKKPTIQLNVDATRMSQAFTGSGYVQTIVNEEIAAYVARHKAQERQPVELSLRIRFNQELNKSWFGGIMGIINEVTMLSIVLTGAALIREREHGTIEHLLVMPVTALEIMLSKIWSMGLVVLVAATLSLIFVCITGSARRCRVRYHSSWREPLSICTPPRRWAYSWARWHAPCHSSACCSCSSCSPCRCSPERRRHARACRSSSRTSCCSHRTRIS